MTRNGAEQLLPLFERVADTVLGSAPLDQVVVAGYTAAAAAAPAPTVPRPTVPPVPGTPPPGPATRRSWSFLENLFANAREGVVFADKRNRILRVNAEFVRMFGYSAEEAGGRTIDELIAPEGRFEEAQSLSQNVENGGFVRQETRRRSKDGLDLDVSILGGPIYEDGDVVGIFAIYRDISERKRVEDAVEASLREKEVLLQEIHHRVKNNMQIISSILSLEIGSLSDPEVRQALQVSQNRIRSMALVHEKLYQSDDLAGVDVAEYVSDLCSD